VANTGSGSQTGNYWVLDTDYNSYSIVYSCSIRLGGFMKTEVAWILSRSRNMSQSAVDGLVSKIRAISPTLASSLKATDQKNCL
jgi:apolipoprotein D and lipocalin family protein